METIKSLSHLATPEKRGGLAGRADLLLALLAVLIIAMMVLPMPPWLLDVLVAVNIASGITLLLFALYVASPLAFSTFPSVLLFATLFRISLNVATTRQILLEANAGEIIDTFGRMVVGGSLVVGLVIFLIITVVQFIVIAKGSERVAEVGARFTLDAMPGKQIAIDSDLRAGLISQAEALEQRRKLSLESQFFGSMDGAMKFVKGDAIASIVIVAVNLLGGMAVGMLVNGMPMSEAVSTYAVLSIGDGLVTQVPALFISMAAGIVVTRTSDAEDGENLASQITSQFASQPRSLMLAGAVIALFALVPGFPVLPFVLLGAAFAWLGYHQGKRMIDAAVAAAGALIPAAARDGDAAVARVVDATEAPFALLAFEVPDAALTATGLEVLNGALALFRDRWRQQTGLPFPGVSVRRNRLGAADRVTILFSETVVRRLQINFATTAPDVMARQIVTELQSAAVQNAAGLLGVQECRWLLGKAEAAWPDLVREAQKSLELPQMATLLSSLIADGVPLRDLRSVLQAVVTEGGSAMPPATLLTRVRQACRRSICAAWSAGGQLLTLQPLQAETEASLDRLALPGRAEAQPMAWPLPVVRALAEGLEQALKKHENLQPVLFVSAPLRAGLAAQLRHFLPSLRVLAHDELSDDIPTQALESLRIDLEPIGSSTRDRTAATAAAG